jgi:glycosyltransferase involved in cell wall biosynthesis
MVRDDRTDMHRLFQKVNSENQFDIVHVDQLNMAQYAWKIPGARRILDEHNALWLLYKRLADTMPFGVRKLLLNRDWKLLKRYEGQLCVSADALLAVSQEDRNALQEAMPKQREITVIPIAIDTDELDFLSRKPNSNRILHIGTMFWPPNIDGIQWFMDNVYPLIKKKRSDVVIDLVGARPPQSIIDYEKIDSAIHVTGYVEDLEPYLEAAAVFVVPLRAGGGMRVKILETLARGLPIVSTTLGCEGIDLEDGSHILIADSPEKFAAATLRLLEDPNLAEQLARNGRARVEELYDYRSACRPLDAIYETSSLTAENIKN